MPARSLHGRSLSHGVRFSVQTASAGRDPSLRLLADATAVRSTRSVPSHGRNTSAGSTTTCVSRRALSEAQNCPPNMAVRLAHPASAASSDSTSNAAQSSAPIGLAPAGGRPHRRYIHRPCVNDNSASATPVARAICAIALGKVSWCRAISDVSCRKCATNAVRPPGRGRSSASSWKVSGLDSPAAPADAASEATRKARSMARATRLESMSVRARVPQSVPRMGRSIRFISDLFNHRGFPRHITGCTPRRHLQAPTACPPARRSPHAVRQSRQPPPAGSSSARSRRGLSRTRRRRALFGTA